MSESDSTDLKGAADASMPQPPDKLEEKQSLWKHTTEVTKEITKKAIKIPKEVTMKMADDVLRWMFTTPTVLHPRQHPEWPGYTGIGTKLDFRLKTQVYDSRCLVDNTVASFYPTEGDRNLTPKQLIARPKIISLFKELQGRTEPFGTSDMNLFMRLLDDFFFAGAVVNKGRPRVFFRVWMSEKQYALHVTGAFLQHTLPWGVTRYRYVRGYGPVSEIHIAGSLVCYDPLPLWLLVQTLIHEMVHAYINLFLCKCLTCTYHRLNTRGISGHGKTFLMLLDCIDQTMRSWDVGLGGLTRGMFRVGPCRAARLCRHVGEHDDKDYKQMFFDEIHHLREREKQLVEEHTLPRSNKASSRPEEKCSSEDTAGAKDTKQERLVPEGVVSGLRPIEMREPGMQVYMTAAQVGATKVEQSMLDHTGDVVQALIAKTATKSSKKLLTKLNLPWPRIGDKSKTQQKQG